VEKCENGIKRFDFLLLLLTVVLLHQNVKIKNAARITIFKNDASSRRASHHSETKQFSSNNQELGALVWFTYLWPQ
jgi:hypothetical protein